MPVERSLIDATAHPVMERALLAKLDQRSDSAGGLGEMGPLAIRLGLIQRSLKPRLQDPQLLVVAGDHGLAVDGIAPASPSTSQQVIQLLSGNLPMPIFANHHGLTLSVVDAGISERMASHPYLVARKIATARATAA